MLIDLPPTRDALARHEEAQTWFAEMIKGYPRLSVYWDWQKREVDLEAIQSAMSEMSSAERVLTKFFLSVWLDSSSDYWVFNLQEAAAILGRAEKQLVADWLIKPFWIGKLEPQKQENHS